MDDVERAKQKPAYRAAMKEIRRRSIAMAKPGTEHGVPGEWEVASGDSAERRPV